jgi:hypothetical protein
VLGLYLAPKWRLLGVSPNDNDPTVGVHGQRLIEDGGA